MNPDFSQLTGEERAPRLTALLLGELPADEAAEIQRALDADPELAREHARLQQTIALVRETTALERKVSADGTPLKLDDTRREKLLAAFQKPAPRAAAARRRRKWFVPASVAAALVGLLVIVFTLPKLTKARMSSQRSFSQIMGGEDAVLLEKRLGAVAPMSARGRGYALPSYGGGSIVPPATAAKAPDALARNLAGVPAADGRVQVSGQLQVDNSFVVNEVMAAPVGAEPAPVALSIAGSFISGNTVVNSADTTLADGLAPLPATAPVPAAGERPVFQRAGRARSDSFGTSSRAAGQTELLTDPQFATVTKSLQERRVGGLLSAPEVTTMSGRQATIAVKDIDYVVTDLDAAQTSPGVENRSKARNLYLGEAENRELGVSPARPAAVATAPPANLDKSDLFDHAVKTPLPADPAGGVVVNYAVGNLDMAQAAPRFEFQITDNGLAKGLGTTPVDPTTGIPAPANGPVPADNSGAGNYRFYARADDSRVIQPIAPATPPPVVAESVELFNGGASALNTLAATENNRLEVAKLVQDGKLYYESGRLQEAEKSLQQAAEIDPQNQSASYYRNLVTARKYAAQAQVREVNSKQMLMEVESAWADPALAGAGVSAQGGTAPTFVSPDGGATIAQSSIAGGNAHGGGGRGGGGGGRNFGGNATPTTPAKSGLLLEQDRAVRSASMAGLMGGMPAPQPSVGDKFMEVNQDTPALGFDWSLGDKTLSDGRAAQDEAAPTTRFYRAQMIPPPNLGLLKDDGAVIAMNGAAVTRSVMAREQAESKDAKALAGIPITTRNEIGGGDSWGIVTTNSFFSLSGAADSPVSGNFYTGLTRDDVGAVRSLTRSGEVKLSDGEEKSRSLVELRNELLHSQGRGDVKLEKAGANAFNDSAWVDSDSLATGSVTGPGTPNFWWRVNGEAPVRESELPAQKVTYGNGRLDSAANPVTGAGDTTMVNQGNAYGLAPSTAQPSAAPFSGNIVGGFGGSARAGVSGVGGFGSSRTGFGNKLNVAVNRAAGAAGGSPAADSSSALRGFFPPRHSIAEDADGPLEVKGLKPNSAANLPKGSALANESDGDGLSDAITFTASPPTNGSLAYQWRRPTLNEPGQASGVIGRVAVQLPGLTGGDQFGRQSSPTRTAGESKPMGEPSGLDASVVGSTRTELKRSGANVMFDDNQKLATMTREQAEARIELYRGHVESPAHPSMKIAPSTPEKPVKKELALVMITNGIAGPQSQFASAGRLVPLPTPNAYARTNSFSARNAFLVTNAVSLFDALPGTNAVRGLAMGAMGSGARAVAPPAPAAIDKPLPKPPPGAPVPQPEVLTRDNAFSTFSLNVSDVSFKLAAASLEKGQMPDAAGIRSEEFLNAFDYRDPLPAAGVPVAFAWERARYPFAHHRDALRFSVKTAAQGREGGKPLNIVLLLDNSGSMERADRVRIIQESLRALAAQLKPQDKLSVVTFARTARLWADGVTGAQAAEIAKQIGTLTPEGGTNLEEAMDLAYRTALRHYAAAAVNRVVLLTDGAANLGNVEPKTLKAKVEGFRKQGVALDCFGIGWDGFNDDLLEQLSRNGDGRYGFVNTPEEAATEFVGQLAGALHVAASDVKVQVEFNPKRVTAYRQIGYAKHQLTKQQFRDNTVDAAEIGAAEAGNGLYIIETNPRGEGPIATVRVRFRIPQTSDYREHEWVVPFGSAVDLEQSSSAMRLAASASAFSEWLASSPFSGEVTTDRLLGLMSGVPEVYGADPRPKKLEWMIRQAKSISGK